MPRKKTCKSCKSKYEPPENARPFENWCSFECALKLANDAKERNRAKAIAKEAKKKREEKKQTAKKVLNLKRQDLDWQKKKTQDSFNRMRVREEKLWFYRQGLEPVCISCGKPNMDWCAGHFKTRGSHTELALDPLNVWLQCNWHCNKNLSGNIHGNKHSHGYIKGLKIRFGEEQAQNILDYLEQKHPPKKWAWQELEALRFDCNKRVRELEIELAEYE